MALRQTRRAVSLSAPTYEAIREDCIARGVSQSEYLEQLIALDRMARGLAPVVRKVRKVRPRLKPIGQGSMVDAGRTREERPPTAPAPVVATAVAPERVENRGALPSAPAGGVVLF